MAQLPDLVFVTYTSAPKNAARAPAVKDLVRKQALKAYYSPQGSDRVEERRKESDALDKKSRKRHMGRFRAKATEKEVEKGMDHGKGDGARGMMALGGRRVFAFEPYIETLGPGAWELLEYFRNCFRMKSMSIHPDSSWFALTMTQNSMAQATLTLVSLNRDFSNGKGIVSPTTLHHRAAAMSQLKSEIELGVDRETVAGTVAILALAEDMEGNFTNSSAHFEGMAQIAKACGGLRWFSGERSCMILKIIAWADLCHAAAWLSEPRMLGWFDDLPQSLDTRLGDPIFRLELERLTCPHLRSMMDILHHFPHPSTMHAAPEGERAHWERLLHMTEQMVIQLKGRIPFEGSVPALSRAFTTAVQLYIPAVLRRSPLPRSAARLFTGEALKELKDFKIRARAEEGRSPRNLLVLWTQVNTLAALAEGEGEGGLVSDLKDTLRIMGIFDEEELVGQLGCIAWSASVVDEKVVDLIDLPLLGE